MDKKKKSLSICSRALSLLLCCAILLPFSALKVSSTASAYLPQNLSAHSAILIDSDGAVLAEKNSRERMGEASTTKIMTALVIAESMPLDTLITIPDEAVGTEGSSVYLCAKEQLTVRELLYALLLESANDAAVALAIASAGSIEAFAEKMNERAYALGLCDTNFKNPHGLFDEEHYTTAYDLAMISAEALKIPALREIFATKKTQISLGVTQETPEGDGKRYLHNHNKLLSRYEGAIGIKTGFTKRTGRCLVSAAERDGMTLIAVTLNAPDDWRDHALLLDYGFDNYERVTLFDVGEFSYQYAVSGGCEQFVRATNSVPLSLTLPKNSREYSLALEFEQRFETAPLAKGTRLGTLTLKTALGESTSPLVAAYSIDTPRKKNRFFGLIASSR